MQIEEGVILLGWDLHNNSSYHTKNLMVQINIFVIFFVPEIMIRTEMYLDNYYPTGLKD